MKKGFKLLTTLFATVALCACEPNPEEYIPGGGDSQLTGKVYEETVVQTYLANYTGKALPTFPNATYTVSLEEYLGTSFLYVSANDANGSLTTQFTANATAADWTPTEEEDDDGSYWYATDTNDGEEYSLLFCWYNIDGEFGCEITFYDDANDDYPDPVETTDVYGVDFVQTYFEGYTNELPEFPNATYTVSLEAIEFFGFYFGDMLYVTAEDADGALLTAFSANVELLWTVEPNEDDNGAYYSAYDTNDADTCEVSYCWYDSEGQFCCEILRSEPADADYLTVAEAIAEIKALGAGNSSEEEVTVGGYISTSFAVKESTQTAGTYQFNMSDSGDPETEELYVWWGACEETPEQGDFVLVTGTLYNYNGTKYEITNSTIVISSGGDDNPEETEYYSYDTYEEACEVFFQNITFTAPTLPTAEWECTIIYDSDYEEYYLDITSWLDSADDGAALLAAIGTMFTGAGITCEYDETYECYCGETDDLYIAYFQDEYEEEPYVCIQYSFVDSSKLTKEDITGEQPVDPVTPGEGYGSLTEPLTVAEAIEIFNTECKGKTATASNSKVYVEGYVTNAGETRNQGGLKNVYIADTVSGTTTLKVSCLLLGSAEGIAVGDKVIICGYLYSFDANTPANMYYKDANDTSTYPTLMSSTEEEPYFQDYDTSSEAIAEYFKDLQSYPTLPTLPTLGEGEDYYSYIYFDEGVNCYVLSLVASDEEETLVDAFEANILADTSGLWGESYEDEGEYYMYSTDYSVCLYYGNDLVDDGLGNEEEVFYIDVIRMDEDGYNPNVTPTTPDDDDDDDEQTSSVLFDFSNTNQLQSGSDENSATWKQGNVTITITKGNSSTGVGNGTYWSNPLRTYFGQVITITWTGDTAPSTITMTTNNTGGKCSDITTSATSNVVGATGTVADNVVTYAVTGNSVAITVTKTGDTSKQLWIQSISVNWAE